LNFESELLKLEEELQSRAYRPGRSICFCVEEPTLREIFAADFRDRVVHHLLYNFLEPIFEPKFIHGSYACRKNKGIHNSIGNLQTAIRKLTVNHRRVAHYLHLDICGFFMALNKDILFRLLESHLKNPDALWLAKTIIFNNPVKNHAMKGNLSLFAKLPSHKSLFHVPENQGLPIGNLTSQFFANVYLNELDQFAKHALKAKYYFRYVDDFLLLSKDKKELLDWRDKIGIFLKERLKLELHPDKQILGRTDSGIDWLGYIIKPGYMLVRKRIVKNFKRKLFEFNKELAPYQGRVSSGQLMLPFAAAKPPSELVRKILGVVNSYLGLFGHADTFRLRRKIWQNHFGKIFDFLEPADGKLKIARIREDFLARPKRAGK